MLTLGIESSCDETAMAVVRDGELLAQVMASQAELHALFGGVVPEIASREHYRILQPLLDQVLKKADVGLEQVESIAVSRGPGLLGALLAGLSFAKGLCLGTGARLVGVDHLQAHLLAAGLEQELVFPALGVLISGGHTHLYHMRSALDLELLGKTLDDAAGEAYDKVARMLGVPYPGGKRIDELAADAEADVKLFPRPYLDNQNLDFSFSGLKTAVGAYLHGVNAKGLYTNPDRKVELTEQELGVICASFNFSVADTLRIKTERALKRTPGVKSLIVAGGVAANSKIRSVMTQLASAKKLKLSLPSLGLCTDNGAMVAYAGELFAKAGFSHTMALDAVPRGKKVPFDYVSQPSQQGSMGEF